MEISDYSEIGIEDLAKYIRRRLRDNYDCIGVITGYQGTGKTNFAIRLAMLVDPKFDIESHIVLGTNFDKIKNQIGNLPQFSAIVYDEGVKQWSKVDWASKIQKSLVKYSVIFRKENKLHLILMPQFEDLTKTFRQQRVFFWVHILDRGVAVLMKALDRSPMVTWYLDDLDKTLRTSARNRKLDIWSIEDTINIMSKSVHYVYTFPFKPLDKEVEDRYLEYYKRVALEGIGSEAEVPDDTRHQYRQMMMSMGHILHMIRTGEITGRMTVTNMAKIIGVNDRTLNKYRQYYLSSSRERSRELHVNIPSSREDKSSVINATSEHLDTTLVNKNISSSEVSSASILPLHNSTYDKCSEEDDE